MTLVEAKKFFKDHAVKFVLAQFVDIHGSPKPNRCRSAISRIC
jgi:hypothetical protein